MCEKGQCQTKQKIFRFLGFFFLSYLGDKHAAESHCGTEADTKAHGYDLVVGAKVNWNKGQPDDTGGVHGEGNVLGLIKISWYITSLCGKREYVYFKAGRGKVKRTVHRKEK